MSKPSVETREDYIKRRYERWRTMAVPFEYKQKKSARIAQIFADTGGLPKTALELGVGPGGIAGPLSERGVRVVGIDLSWDALQRAQAHCRGQQVHLLRGSGFALPFPDGTFPVVYASQVLHLFDGDGRLNLMREVRRVLARDGRFVFDMKNVLTHAVGYWRASGSKRRRNFPSTQEITDLLDKAGFTSVDTRPGVMPGLGAVPVPNAGVFRAVAHTVFFVARPS